VPPSRPREVEVSAAYTAWDEDFNKGNAKAVAAFYTDDAIFLPTSHEVIRGPAGVEKFLSGFFCTGVTGHKLELMEAHSVGNLVFCADRWSDKGKDANGNSQPWSGLPTHFFKRQPDGSLKIQLHTFS
jgi:ketosteroid isomerase-like protein